MKTRRTRAAWLIGAVAVVVLALAPGHGMAGQPSVSLPSVPPPSTVRPQSQVFDRLESAVTRPLPEPPPIVSRPHVDTRWVPDQRVFMPGVGHVHVPGHWQHRLPSGDILVPPVVTRRAEDASVVVMPGGVLSPPDPRQAP